ncbi:hypothetical protein Tco_0127681 [Tanacetum coccineum]
MPELHNKMEFAESQQEANHNAGTKDKIVAGDSENKDESAQDCLEVPFWHSYSSTNTSSSKSDIKRGSPREEEQVFLDDLARLQRQEKEANEEAKALTKNLEQENENLVTQGEADITSGTNIISTVSTTAKASGTNFVNTVSIPVGTASANEGLSLSNTTNSQEDDYEIPPLEDIHEDATDGIFTHSSYDDEGAVADFTNLETIVNVSPIPTSRVHPFHPSTLILGDPTSAVQTRSKVNKSSEAHAFFLRFKRVQDPKSPQKVYKVVKALYGLHQAPRAWISMLDEIQKNFDFAKVKSASKPIETQKPLSTDVKKLSVLVQGFQVSTFDLESYSDSDYALGANLERGNPQQEFWTSAKCKTINNARHITAKVAGKLVSISEASIRTDLLFDDADGIDTLPNQAIFDAIQLMGYEGDLTKEYCLQKDYRSTPTILSLTTSEAPTESLMIPSSAQSVRLPFEQPS